MPILVTPVVAPPPAPTGQVAAPVYASARWLWTSAAGRVRDLTTEHPYLRPGGVNGHMAAPVALIDSRPPGMDGGIYRGRRFEPREVQLAAMAHTRDSLVWRDTYRLLVEDFDTGSGDGLLSVQHVDGSVRSLRCRYVNGLGSPVDGEPGVVKIGTFIIELRAYDPWWYGPVQTRTFQPGVTGGFPWPPIVIQSTELIGSGSVVTNPGDVEAYPVWTLTGPLASVTATAEDGSSWTVTKTLDPGESILVDTDPRASALRRVIDQSGTNLWGVATPDYPNLWALPPGESTIEVDVSGSSAATRIQMEFNPRYRTA